MGKRMSDVARQEQADRLVSREEAYGAQPPAYDPKDDERTTLIVVEDELQSRLARAVLDDGVREEIRLLLADAFQRWRNAIG